MSDPIHQQFLATLDDSEVAVWMVARWAQNRFTSIVVIPPVRKAEKREDWQDFSDGGDLFIQHRIEVKRLGFWPDGTPKIFTGRHDWPYKNKYIVCSKHSFDRAFPKPYAYVMVSRDWAAAGIVYGKNQPSWTVEKKLDKTYKPPRWQDCYMTTTDKVKFFKLNRTRNGQASAPSASSAPPAP